MQLQAERDQFVHSGIGGGSSSSSSSTTSPSCSPPKDSPLAHHLTIANLKKPRPYFKSHTPPVAKSSPNATTATTTAAAAAITTTATIVAPTITTTCESTLPSPRRSHNAIRNDGN